MIKVKSMIVVLLLIFGSNTLFSQVVVAPNWGLKSHETMQVLKVERLVNKTVFYLSVENRVETGAFCADRNIQLIDNEGRRYQVTTITGIPICPEQYRFKRIGEVLNFTLEFPALPAGLTWVDLIEQCNDNCFQFYGIVLHPGVNKGMESAYKLIEKGEYVRAIEEFKSLLNGLTPADRGIAGVLMINIIQTYREIGNHKESATWLDRLKGSDVPDLEYILRSLGENAGK